MGLVLAVGVTACASKTPNEGKILDDYNAQATEYAYANFDHAELVSEQYDKENKQFSADVTLTGKDDYAGYEADVRVTYHYDDEQGWVLDGYSNPDVTVRCFEGMSKKEFDTYDKGEFVSADAVYESDTFDALNNRHYFYFNTVAEKDGEYREIAIFEYRNGSWEYVTTDRYRTKAYPAE